MSLHWGSSTSSVSSDASLSRPAFLVGFPERPLCKAAVQIESTETRPAANREVRIYCLFLFPRYLCPREAEQSAGSERSSPRIL